MLAILTAMALAVPIAPGKGSDFEYKHGSVALQGYVSRPTGKPVTTPAVLIVHDWDGLGTYEKSRADQLAALGYVGFAVDVYGKGVRPKTMEECQAESGKYYADPKLLQGRLKAAVDAARGMFGEYRKPLAAIGYCFGGMSVLELARAGANLRAVVSFHGSLATKNSAKKGVVRSQVLVLHGAADPLVPRNDVEALKTEMRSAGVKFKFVEYPGAVHSFTVPGAGGGAPDSPVRYDANADKKSWEEMKAFLKRVFGR